MGDDDPRPAVWVGHIALHTPDLDATRAFLETVGMRFIVEGDGYSILELRGGTHLALLPAEAPVDGEPAPFDLMVDDVPATHARLREVGLHPGEIRKGEIHDSFLLLSPSGHLITVNSSHVSDLPV